MRPLAVILIWVVILGGLGIYMQSREYFSPREEQEYEIEPAPGEFTLEVTPTFDATGGVDPYALDPAPQPAFTLKLDGVEIVRREEPMRAAHPTTIQWDLEKWPLVVGKNEFFIDMPTPQRGDDSDADDFSLDLDDSEEADADHGVNAVYGVRLRLLRDGAEVDSQTLWSEPGKPVKGKMFIELDRPPSADPHHEHTT